jgi:hypothetical protein
MYVSHAEYVEKRLHGMICKKIRLSGQAIAPMVLPVLPIRHVGINTTNSHKNGNTVNNPLTEGVGLRLYAFFCAKS